MRRPHRAASIDAWMRRVASRTALVLAAAATARCAVAHGEVADLESALCSGLAVEIVTAAEQQHVDRAAVPIALRLTGVEGDLRAARLACIGTALGRVGYTADADDGNRRPDALRISIGIPDEPALPDFRVEFTVSRCVPGRSHWVHPGYVDFHAHDGAWTNDAAVITKFVDGRCGNGRP